ncbi:GyrI-like domain-containing protein [Methylorubrum suomiense]|uniref:AraC effector-binding domain-containing protein n=1 Tax=Methylorubrum suomiense TaxID=144191 RepID=A0ABQ4UW44_9HYPH|nr:hypothetical protein BGCPKDLD_2625 [Methylorubrum suomiense]
MTRSTLVAVSLLVLGPLAALAQTPAPGDAPKGAPPPTNAPSPAETNPLPLTTSPDPSKSGPGTAMPAPEQAPVRNPGGSDPAPIAKPGPSALPTLVPNSGEANDVDEVTLPAKPAAILSGQTKWEDAVASLTGSFRTIEAALAKAGLKAAGRPLSVFTKTEEDGFQYEAMIPIEAAPAGGGPVDGVRFGSTPSGRALRFKHNGTYEEIDGTYETLTAYLDVKEIDVQDRFVEEYVSDLKSGSEDKLDINIYALPK